MSAVIMVGNCVEVMQRFPDGFFDSIVTDPPYGLKFMSKKWDNVEYGFHKEWADQAIRVLKPGGHLVSFGGTRTYHRMASAVEDAGFEIRDMVQWLYGQGFPKSRNIGNDLDDWEGWGTALKPAQEPIVLARKPLIGTVAKNVLEHGTGALNIDATRIGTTEKLQGSTVRDDIRGGQFASGHKPNPGDIPDYQQHSEGRWPANVILDEEAGEMLDEQTGKLISGKAANGGHKRTSENMEKGSDVYGGGRGISGTSTTDDAGQLYGDSGGASRFFYTAKASRTERNAGLDHLEEKDLFWSSGTQSPGTFQSEGTKKSAKNNHPTVKPIALMRYLIRLVTPPGGRVLDPFAGSGTTGIAAVLEGFNFVGVEMEAEYAAIAKARIKHWKETL